LTKNFQTIKGLLSLKFTVVSSFYVKIAQIQEALLRAIIFVYLCARAMFGSATAFANLIVAKNKVAIRINVNLTTAFTEVLLPHFLLA